MDYVAPSRECWSGLAKKNLCYSFAGKALRVIVNTAVPLGQDWKRALVGRISRLDPTRDYSSFLGVPCPTIFLLTASGNGHKFRPTTAVYTVNPVRALHKSVPLGDEQPSFSVGKPKVLFKGQYVPGSMTRLLY